MQAGDYERFHSGISGVYAFYGKDLSAFALDVWWNALRAFDLTAVTEAFNRWLVNTDSGQYLPKPADVLKMLGGTTSDRAMVAWSKVDKAIRHIGTYTSVVFDDPLVHRVLCDMGGWVALGSKTENEWPFVAKEFENRYRGYSMRSENPDYLPVMIGVADAHNEKSGFKTSAPILVGNHELARKVMLGGCAHAEIEYRSAGEHAITEIRRIMGKVEAA